MESIRTMVETGVDCSIGDYDKRTVCLNAKNIQQESCIISVNLIFAACVRTIGENRLEIPKICAFVTKVVGESNAELILKAKTTDYQLVSLQRPF